MTFGLKPLVPIRRLLLIARKIGPVEIPLAANPRFPEADTWPGTAASNEVP